ncbi:hypothetical protein BDY21DRAFT_338170 [Lineolata rhizophorae]|uniref:Glycosyl hydrolases family 22 (GH22) domain-containing protein n=1 Tax=Lineolata rhizophorae TaxID=578093 RepID=A0A6A6P5Y0_9PEZI|nr:hypothetical protein BDY21DRAFT_338170 [Lineolata rhizophorae]
MQWSKLIALALIAPSVNALLRFSCSQLVVERLDPLVAPGVSPSSHLHQIIGGNSFNASMDPANDIPGESTCTTCTFTEDFSNYWTAVLFFRARNGTFHRVPQRANQGFEQANGGMTVYYTPSYTGGSVTAFSPGFRMLVGNPMFRSEAEASQFRQLTFTCLDTLGTRTGETMDMPTRPCQEGIMANIRFPTCWDGVNLDSADHQSHVAYPQSGTFESGGPCPSTHPVPIPQLFYEVIWDTRQFNDQNEWPEDGSQPFVWSYGDPTGYGTHGDYVFGWQGDALQKAMDSNCNIYCPELGSQDINQANQCTMQPTVQEDISGWLDELPGGMPVTS